MTKTITLETLKEKSKVIFNQSKSAKVSDRYVRIEVGDVIENLVEMGWEIRKWGEQRGRSEALGKYMVMLSNPNLKFNDEYEMSIVIFSSHNGTKAFEVKVGAFVKVCSNGLVVPVEGTNENLKLKHYGITAKIYTENLIQSVNEVLAKAKGKLFAMQNKILSGQEMENIARKAVNTFGITPDSNTISALLTAEFEEQSGNTLFDTFMRIQGNMMRGNYTALTPNGTPRKRRAMEKGEGRVSNVQRYIQTNEALTEMMMEYL